MNGKTFAKLTSSVKQAGRIRAGKSKASRTREIKPLEIKSVRKRLGYSQAEFALMIGVGLSTLQNWEQGRRRPERTANHGGCPRTQPSIFPQARSTAIAT